MNTKSNGAFAAPTTHSPVSGTPEPVARVKRCCGVLVGDECDCAAFAAEARGVFARPIMCRPAHEWGA